MVDVASGEQVAMGRRFLETLAAYRRSEDIINIGAYAKGSNPKIDYAIQMIDRMNGYLRQTVEEKVSMEGSAAALLKLFH
jgi:flagellum-specific ATP synthase